MGTQGAPGDIEVEAAANGSRLAMEGDGEHGGSAAVAVFVAAGSRDEQPREWGAAHLLEHLAFKGAGGLSTAQLGDRMDRLGGDVNAYTTREVTCYHAHCLAEDGEAAFQLVWALATAPHLEAEDLERERGVVAAEQREALNDPEDRAENTYLKALWGDHPVSREVLGSAASLRRMTIEGLRAFHARTYAPERTLVVVAGRWGGANPAEARARMLRRMAAWAAPSAVAPPPRGEPTPFGAERLARLAGDQAYVVLGWPAVPWYHPDAMIYRMLGIVLGGQNTSRLWQRIREQEGLAYQVGAGYSGHRDHGDLSLSAAVAADQVERVVTEMAAEWRGLTERPPTPDEMDRAATQIKIGIVFQEESPEGRLHRVAPWVAAGWPVPTVADLVAAVDRVSRDDVLRVVDDLNRQGMPRIALAAAGPRRALVPGLRARFVDESGVPS